MAKSKKKISSPFVSFNEKQRYFLRKFNLATLFLTLVIIVNSAIAWGCNYELGKPDPEGFLVWFLLFLAYLPLEIFGVVSWLAGFSQEVIDAFLNGKEALILGICDLIMVLTVWLLIRFAFFRRYGMEALRICTTFLLIFAFWGIFQLVCYGAVSIWNHGGLSPLHQHLHRPAPPEKVIIVSPQNGNNINPQ